MIRRRYSLWCLPVFGAMCLSCVAVAQALGQEGTKSVVADGTILCGDRDDAVEVINILRDPDTEVVARRLLSMIASGDCRGFRRGEPYDAIEVPHPKLTIAEVRAGSAKHDFSTQSPMPVTSRDRPHRLASNSSPADARTPEREAGGCGGHSTAESSRRAARARPPALTLSDQQAL
jgi:hypothetical protein